MGTVPYFSAISSLSPHGSNRLGITSRFGAGVDQMSQALIEPDFQVTVGVVVSDSAQVPEVSIDARVGTSAQQDELRALGQGVENGVLDEVDALLVVDAADVGDDQLVLLPQQQPVPQGILVRIFPLYLPAVLSTGSGCRSPDSRRRSRCR